MNGTQVATDRGHDIAELLASLSGTLLGFLITAVALLTAVMDRGLVANMRKTGHYQRLMHETFATCIALLATTVLSVLSMFFDGTYLAYILAGSLAMAVLSLLYVIEAGRRFSNVVVALN